MEWISVEDRLPEETNSFLVTKNTSKRRGIAATFVHLTGKWMANINGIIWEIVGVQYYRDHPEPPKSNSKITTKE